MATVQVTMTPSTDTAPAEVSIPARELSGVVWVARFPTSIDTADLIEPFQTNINNFLAAIVTAGGTRAIKATYRPAERAYLMHYCSKLSKGEIAAASIPAMEGVNIEWVHSTEVASKAAATAMAGGYGIVYPPALISNHSKRTAIDVVISGMVGKTIANATGTRVTIAQQSDLNAVGATYGVIKLVSDPPHWSDDGH